MPNFNPCTVLELPPHATVDAEFLRILNERLAEISRRFDLLGCDAPTAASAETEAAAADEHYTIVFTKDGGVANGEASPSFTVNESREGLPVKVSLTADTAPSGTSLSVQFSFKRPGLPTANVLSSPVILPVGSEGPVYATNFTFDNFWAAGTKVKMSIITAGAAGKVVGEILMRRSS
jgi:hypothetical protein